MNTLTPTPTVVTITGIRPDFIRMCKVFKKLDENFNHILIHTGQHYDELLSSVFFKELSIRKPDYTLKTGSSSKNHLEQMAYLSIEIPKLLKEKNIEPDIVLFLGDSNSVCVSLPLKKEGYKIGHIESGMRSGDRRMLEEINRTVCDHCSDAFFVYHNDYKHNLQRENLLTNVFVVGNTIVEPAEEFKKETNIMNIPKRNDMILVDIHRPENFKYPERLQKILSFCELCSQKYKLPVKLLYFKRLQDAITQYNIKLQNIEMIPLMSYKKYLECAYHSYFVISDSGSACEELPLLDVPVVVPREYTERPQSYITHCSVPISIDRWDGTDDDILKNVFEYIEKTNKNRDVSWLYPEQSDSTTSQLIIDYLKKALNDE